MSKPQRLGAASVAALTIGVMVYQFGFRSPASAPVSTGPAASSIAVLYFEDLSSDNSLGYLADGLTEGLIDRLSRVRALDVVSRNGVAQFRSGKVSRDSIARALEAGTLIVGTVEPERDQVRVTTQLVDGRSGAPFERASFVLPADALLAVLDSVTKDVSRLLRSRVGEEIRTRELRAGTSSVEAWALVQRGEKARKEAEALAGEDDISGAVERFLQADSLLEAAEGRDGNWAEPVVLRARNAYQRSRLEHDPHDADKFWELSIRHAERALRLEHNNADALELRGTVRYSRWLMLLEPDPAAAEKLLDDAEQDLVRATELDQQQANAWNVLSHLYYQRDDIVEANAAARRAYEADAYLTATDLILWRLYATSYDLEVFPQAIHWCDEGLRRFAESPAFYECQLWLLASRAKDPDVNAAWRLAEQVGELTPEHEREATQLRMHVVVAAVLARAAAADPDLKAVLADSARRVLDRSRGNPEVDPVRQLLMLQAFARTLLDDRAEAVELLSEYLVANPDRREGFAQHRHWWWRSLQDDPQFRRLVGTAR